MKKILTLLMIASLSMLFYQCGSKDKSTTIENEDADLSYDPMIKENKIMKEEMDKAWEEARAYNETITDTTFLRTRGTMSQLAIQPFKGEGDEINKDFAFNQYVYVAALERAKKHLSVKDNQFIFNTKSGAELNISEDLYRFIADVLFKDWNTWVKEGKLFKIIKTEEGYYDIGPINERVN